MSLYAEILSDAPEAFWKLDETSGTSAADASGNGHTGTYVNSPTLNQASLNVTDPAEKSVSFNGSSQYVDCGTHAAFALAGNFSGVITFTGGTPGSVGVGFSRFNDGIGQGFSFRQSTTGLLELYYLSSSGFVSIDSGDVYTSGNHIAHFLHDTTGIYLFVDGVLKSSDTTAAAKAHITTNTQKIMIAAQDHTSPRHFNGSIGLACFYDIALSATRILAQAAAFLYDISVNVTESLVADNFIATVYDFESAALIVSQNVISGSNTILLGDNAPVLITVRPDIGGIWTASIAYALDDLVFSTDPATYPGYWKCTTAGTSGSSEPTWNMSGTTNDGASLVWTFQEGIEDPQVRGPLIPA